MSVVVSNTVTVTVTALVATTIDITVSSGSIVYGQNDTISGTVYDQESNPLGGVTVYLWENNANTGYKWSYSGLNTTSNSSNGTFSFTISSSNYYTGNNTYAVTTSSTYGPA